MIAGVDTVFVCRWFLTFNMLLLFSRQVMSNSSRFHRLQHARVPCPSPSPGVHPRSCPLNWWCHPTVSAMSRRAHQSVFPRTTAATVFVLTVSRGCPASSGVPLRLAGWCGLFSWVLVCMRLCVSPPRVELFFLSVLWDSWGGSSSHCQTSRLGSLMWGSELSLLWEKFCGVIIFQFMNFPCGRYGIWFYCFGEPLLPSCPGLFFVFGCRYLFVGSSVFLFDACSSVTCYCGVFIRRGELTSFYSAILSPQKLVLKSTVTHPLTYTHTHKDHLGCVIICYFKFHSDLYVIWFLWAALKLSKAYVANVVYLNKYSTYWVNYV